MKRLCFLLLFLFSATISSAADNALTALGWLAGCWSGTGEVQYTEQWMAPGGGMMLGMSRTVRPGKTTSFECMRIVEENGKLFYIAKPSDQPETKFAITKSGPLEFVFENRRHNFPQRIVYRLQTDGSLVARIERKNNGKDESVDFPMKRAQCAGEAAVCSAD